MSRPRNARPFESLRAAPSSVRASEAAPDSGRASEAAPFERLVKLIERELELAGEGRTRELREAVASTGAYLKTLPSPAPRAASGALRRARALRARVAIETQRVRESLELSRAALRRSRRLTRTYGAPRQQAGKRYSASA